MWRVGEGERERGNDRGGVREVQRKRGSKWDRQQHSLICDKTSLKQGPSNVVVSFQHVRGLGISGRLWE